MQTFGLTWGQTAQLDHFRRNGFDMPGTLLRGVWLLPAPVPADRAARAVNLLVARHDVLHTTYPGVREYPPRSTGTPDGTEVTQRVEPVRPVPVPRVLVARDELVTRCRSLLAQARRSTFDPEDASSLMAQLVCTERGAEAVVVAASHQAVDFTGLDILRGEFRTALSGAALGPVRQPRAQVALEAAGRARAARDAAVQHLGSALRRAPLPFLTTGRPREQLHATSATVLSQGLAEDVVRIGRACRSTVPAVLSTLVMLLLAAHTDERRVLVRSLYHRRHWMPGESYVAPQNLAALILLDLPAGATIAEAFELGRRATTLGYTHTDYDPFALLALENEVARCRGIAIDGFCLFNFMGSARRPRRTARPGDPGGDVRSTGTVAIPLNMRFIFACAFHPTGALDVEVQIDERLAGVTAARLLTQIRQLAAYAAHNPAAPVHDAVVAAGITGG